MTAAADKARLELEKILAGNPELNALTPTELNHHLSQLLDTPGAAKFLGCSPTKLQQRRALRGHGPRYLRLGGAIRYELRDLLLWRELQRRASTNEYETHPGSGRPRKPAA